jgi:hypothetical protein
MDLEGTDREPIQTKYVEGPRKAKKTSQESQAKLEARTPKYRAKVL